jgi:type IV secretory pathway VirB10-like protein
MHCLSKANGVLVPVVLFLASLALPASAPAQDRQSSSSAQVTASDIQRLQDAIYDAGLDVRRLGSHSADLAERLQGRLDDLRDEVVYLKVKQRKDGVLRAEYNALRDEIEGVRTEARSAVPAAGAGVRPAATTEGGDDTRPAQQGKSARPNEVPAGTELDVRLEKPISSDSAQVEDRFTATTVADLYNGNKVLIPAGSAVRGVVTSVNKAGRIDRTGKLTLAFDRVTVDGRSYPMHGTVTKALQSGGYRQDAGKIGAGAGVGAIIGGILGGMKGALAGILIGGGGVVAATEGQDVNLPAETVLRIRLDSAISVR